MKKLLLLSLTLFIFSNITFSQSKKVLFEEFTNASCGPCAASNPSLKAYLESKGDTIIAVKYHTYFPGFDPMNTQNATQVENRRTGYYTDVNAVPWLKGDGNCFPDIWPFSQQNFDNAFNTRKAIVPQLTISVSNSIIAGDSVKAQINIHIPSTLPAGNYKIRVMAAEKVIEFTSPPGSNGERIFEHVFRKGAPDMTGFSFGMSPPQAGDYLTYITYKIESYWDLSKMVTIVFVQNDAASDKEVLNVNVSSPLVFVEPPVVFPLEFSLGQNYPNPFNPETNINFSLPRFAHAKLTVYNSLGEEIAVLADGVLNEGRHSFKFNAAGLSSGVYFYKLETLDFTSIKKMTLIK